MISIQLNFLPMENADSSFETIIISLIVFAFEITSNISFSIISQRSSFLVAGKFNLDLDLEKDFTGIITEVFKLLFDLF